MTADRCADLSAEAGESLAATATTAESWLLVEVRGTWPRDVSDGAGLDDASRDAVRAWLDGVPSSRMLYIRRPGRPRDRRLAFVARATEHETEIRRIELERDEALGDVDLATAGEVTDTSLVLVCGHGTRDACCALRGSAVYGALAERAGLEQLWLSSHQGGHRFAANVLVLPGGIQLGRLSIETAAGVVGAAVDGQVALDHYRGRTMYTPRQQAAERAVRDATGLTALADLALAGEHGEHVSFVTSDARELRAATDEVSGPTVPASCGQVPSPQRRFVAQLV